MQDIQCVLFISGTMSHICCQLIIHCRYSKFIDANQLKALILNSKTTRFFIFALTLYKVISNHLLLLMVHQPLQHFILAARSDTFKAVKKKRSDNDQSRFIFSICVLGKMVHFFHFSRNMVKSRPFLN